MVDDFVVTVSGGRLRGRTEGGVTSFRNIPYAAAPVGRARFEPPRPSAAWPGVRDATEFGATAPQPRRDVFGDLDMSPYFGPGWIRGEDYLSVNVWTPTHALPGPGRDRGTAGLPVVVFVHGGGSVAGSPRAALYDGSAFARDGIVSVTVAYRLGVTGFLRLAGAEDNRGLLDIIAALRWVRDEIPAFGGDPDAVTIMGQSAGATLVGALLATPAAHGLFARSIVQSGSGTGALDPRQADRVTDRIADALGVKPDVDGFAEMDDESLVAAIPAAAGLDLALPEIRDPLAGLSPFSVVLPRQPADVVASRGGAAVDLLIGVTAEEGNLYLVPSGAFTATGPDEARMAAAAMRHDPDSLLDRYRRTRPDASWGQIRSAILGDALFGIGTRALADAHAAAGRSVHAYRFDWRSSALDGLFGAAHTVDLPFTFGNIDLPVLYGPHSLLGAISPPADLAARTHRAWCDFIRTGEPGWTRYHRDARWTQQIGPRWETVHDPRAGELEA